MNEIPAFDFWMLGIIDGALQKEYDRYMKASDIGQQLSLTRKSKGSDKAKKCLLEIEGNKYHPLGQIALTKLRIQEIKDVYNAAAGMPANPGNEHCVAKMINGEGKIVYRVMTTGLAKAWNLCIEHTGTHKECLQEQGRLSAQL